MLNVFPPCLNNVEHNAKQGHSNICIQSEINND